MRTDRPRDRHAVRSRRRRRAAAGFAWLLVAAAGTTLPAVATEIRVSEGTNLSVDVAPDGELAMDLLGRLWRLPRHGGDAEQLTAGLVTARQPRFSPDGRSLLYQAETAAGPQLWRYHLDSGERSRLSREGAGDRQGDWHPGGARLVFVSERGDTGLDVWEQDIATGLEWRLTRHPGDETAPAWSADGRHLSYVLHEDERWYLMLRRFGRPPEPLLESPTPLHAPSWRPDGTLITYLASSDDGLELRMLILADPPLDRSLIEGEDFFISPTSWKDRNRYYYAADGTIKTRTFDAWESRRVHFSAAVERPEPRPNGERPARPLPEETAPGAGWVVRARRLYDGHEPAYRRNVDVVIDGGAIAAVEEQRDRGGRFVLDLGEVTVMPGLIDVYGAMPDGEVTTAGARLLAFGVTTLIAPDAPQDLAARWASAETPGPRLLRAVPVAGDPGDTLAPALRLAVIDERLAAGGGLLEQVRSWQGAGVPVLAKNGNVGLTVGADLLLGAAVMPASPRGKRYEDLELVSGNGPLTFLSGLADAGTPGIAELTRSRQAEALPAPVATARRYAEAPTFGSNGATLVLGSRPSGLPAGFATQAEIRALAATGLAPARVLHAATGAAATVLGLEGKLGSIRPGAEADLLLVAGDPLADAGDALNVVGVVRDGRFFSLSGLLELAGVE